MTDKTVDSDINMPSFADLLLRWYDGSARDLPWRVKGRQQDPYQVMLSEFMLQQTVAATVVPYFMEFIRRWPNVEALAQANDDDVMAAWAGLGYYARARNLLKAVRVIASEGWPDDVAGLKSLPGVGPYTAAAIGAIAFETSDPVVDGNVARVISRHADYQDVLKSPFDIQPVLVPYMPNSRYGDFAQAMMDLGARICRPKNPKCGECPVAHNCLGFQNDLLFLPNKPKKIAKKIWQAHAYVMCDASGAIAYERRPTTGLLGGQLGVPMSVWAEAVEFAPPVKGNWIECRQIKHIFTHIELTVNIWRLNDVQADLMFRGDNEVALDDLPSLFRKIILAATK